MGNKIPFNEIVWQTINAPFTVFGDKNTNRNREEIFRTFSNYLMIRCLGMFKYEGLPETLNPEMMEKFMMRTGYCIITKVGKNAINDGGIYTLQGGLGGLLDTNFNPTLANVNSPYLQVNKVNMKIGEDCIVIRNDPLYMGLVPLISYYASQLAEGGITLRLQLVNMRTNVLYHANDDTAKEDAKRYLDDIQEGKLGVIGGDSFFDGIDFDTKDASPKIGASIKDTLEAMQYLIARFFISIGLNDNYNMKREAVNSSETSANEYTLLTLVEQMLSEREKGIERLNKLYGLSARVSLNGAWARTIKDQELAQEEKEANIESMNDDPKDDASKDEPEDAPEKKEGEE